MASTVQASVHACRHFADQHRPRVAQGPALRRLVLLALFAFVFALQMTFPYDRVKDKLVEALVGQVRRHDRRRRARLDAGPRLLQGRHRCARARPSPTRPVTTFYIEQARGRPRLVAAASAARSPSISTRRSAAASSRATSRCRKFGRGDIAATSRAPTCPARACRCARDRPADDRQARVRRSTLDLPIEKSKLGEHRDQLAEGRRHVSLGVPDGCTFGDGKTEAQAAAQEHARNQAMVGDGIDFGKVNTRLARSPKVDDQERQARRSTSSRRSQGRRAPRRLLDDAREGVRRLDRRGLPALQGLRRPHAPRAEDARRDLDHRRGAARRWPVPHPPDAIASRT